jgi:Skp family chaperone for outer membrane proteins
MRHILTAGSGRKLVLLAVMVSALAMGRAPAALAQDKAAATAPAVKIAVLDDQKILSTSLAAKSIDTQLKARRDTIEKELAALERKLAETKNKLDAQKDKVKQEDVEAFRKDYADARKLADTRHQELEKAATGALAQMRGAITKIVTDMAEKNGYTLILTRQNVVLADSSMDITDNVMAQLDKDLPSVSVSFDSAKKAAK